MKRISITILFLIITITVKANELDDYTQAAQCYSQIVIQCSSALQTCLQNLDCLNAQATVSQCQLKVAQEKGTATTSEGYKLFLQAYFDCFTSATVSSNSAFQEYKNCQVNVKADGKTCLEILSSGISGSDTNSTTKTEQETTHHDSPFSADQIKQFFEAWNNMFNFAKAQNLEQIFQNRDEAGMKIIKKEYFENIDALSLNQDKATDAELDQPIEDDDFIIAMRFYKFYLNHQQQFEKFGQLNSTAQSNFIENFFKFMDHEDQSNKGPDDVVAQLLRTKQEQRKEEQKKFISDLKSTVKNHSEKIDALKQLIGFESKQNLSDVENLKEKHESMNSELMKTAMNEMKEMIELGNFENKDDYKEFVKIQKEVMKAQMEDFKNGVFSNTEQDLESFKQASKENAKNFKKAIHQFGKYLNDTTNQLFDKDLGLFAKKYAKDAIEKVTEKEVDLGWEENDINGRKLGCKFPASEFQKLFQNNASLSNIKTEVESFIGGMLTDLVELSLTDESGNPISVQNLAEKIKVQIPKIKGNSKSKECFYLDENSTPVTLEASQCTETETNYEIQTDHLTQFGVKESNAEVNSYQSADYSNDYQVSLTSLTNCTEPCGNNDGLLKMIFGSLFIIGLSLLF